MKALLLADSHDKISTIKSFNAIYKEIQPDIIFHAGDIVFPPFINELLKDKKNVELHVVKGNNDGETVYLDKTVSSFFGYFYYEQMIKKFCTKNICMIHKPDLVEYLAKSQEFDYIFYGHTHKIEIKTIGKTVVVNPGSFSGYLADKSSIAFIDIENSKEEIIFLH